MARHKDGDWKLPEGRLETWEQVNSAILMDIRDELKQLNAVFACHNAQRIPFVLDQIQKNTRKPAKKKRKKKI